MATKMPADLRPGDRVLVHDTRRGPGAYGVAITALAQDDTGLYLQLGDDGSAVRITDLTVPVELAP